jgi:uncharacterized membrane protein
MSASGTRSSRTTADSRHAGAWALGARFAGALALAAVGVVHLQQYVELYSTVPTSGTLFLLNFTGAVLLALVLLCPVERWAGGRGEALTAIAAVGGIALAGIAFVFLAVSEHSSIFGFHEPGYDPTAIAVARIAEVAAVVLLAAYLIARFALNTSTRRW